MSLTRNNWLEMWTSVKIIEFNISELGKDFNQLSPFSRKKINKIIREITTETNKIKIQIQSVIGQME